MGCGIGLKIGQTARRKDSQRRGGECWAWPQRCPATVAVDSGQWTGLFPDICRTIPGCSTSRDGGKGGE